MHCANRAKARMRLALEASKSDQITPKAKASVALNVNDRRSKSLDRKNKRLASPRTLMAKYSKGPDSDSGLSCLDLDHTADRKSWTRNVDDANSAVDSGRRSQSLELLSDDLQSVSISSTPSPRPPSHMKRGQLSRGHVHFLSQNTPDVQKTPSESERPLRKSTSIPVHLTVSGNNRQVLPPGLRPNPSLRFEDHEADCPTQKCKKKWASSSAISTPVSLSRTSTPTTITRPSKPRPPVNSYSLPRSASSRSRLGESSTPTSSRDQDKVARSRSNISINESTRPHSSASNGTTSSLRRPRRPPRAMNASLQIWEIQKELKRGEMVQGVLQLGPPRSTFGSRYKEPKEKETCICAPVVIGGRSGHMDWRSM